MGLRPELEARVRACEADVEQAIEVARGQIARIEEIQGELEEDPESFDGIPLETFDDPSVVRHVEDLSRTARRAKRISDAAIIMRRNTTR